MNTHYHILQEALSGIRESLPLLFTEYSLLGLILLLFFQALFLKEGKKGMFFSATTTIGLFFAIGVTFYTPLHGNAWLGMMHISPISLYLKVLFLLCALFTIGFERGLKSDENRKHGEWYLFILSLTLGACLMVSAKNLLMMYVSMEIVSISGYLLTAFNRKSKAAAEAGVKYILFGAFSSALMLYGLSWIYGGTGSLDITPDFIEHFQQLPQLVQLLILTFVLSGFWFKIGLFPFHFWIPEVYDNISYPTVAFFSVVPKVAGFGMLMYLMSKLNAGLMNNEGVKLILSLSAVFSMTIGNTAALTQKTVKRMLAFSAIAHSGFMALALIPTTTTSYAGLMFYAGVYTLMNFGAFVIAGILSDNLGNDSISSYSGIGTRFPLLMLAFTICMAALIGLPPTAGFIGKWYIFIGLWDIWSINNELLWIVLLIAAVLNTVISIYYYLKLPANMIFKANPSGSDKYTESVQMKLFGLILSSLLIVGGIWKFDIVIEYLKLWLSSFAG